MDVGEPGLGVGEGVTDYRVEDLKMGGKRTVVGV